MPYPGGPTGYPPPVWGWPETLPYDDNPRGPVPFGYHLETHKGRGLIVAGIVLFGSGWLLSLLGAGTAALNETGQAGTRGNVPVAVPLAGPFIALGTSKDARQTSAIGALFLFDGLSQAGGVAMFIGGMVKEEKLYVRNDVGRRDLRIPNVAIGPRGGALTWAF
jgi:hypothetical protein